MTVPDFQFLMRPFLKLTGDQNENSIATITKQLADELSLTEEEINEWDSTKT